MFLTVVIPTFNRVRKLKECFNALFIQDLPPEDFEIIVVDDGSTDDTGEIVKKMAAAYGAPVEHSGEKAERSMSGAHTAVFGEHEGAKEKPAAANVARADLRYFRQKNGGRGIAVNLGISKAQGKVIVLIDDDFIATSSFLSEHMRYHLRHESENEAVLGITEWHPRLTQTPFMKWLANRSRPRFAYDNFFYTSNISLKKSLLIKHPFDPAFSDCGREDIELGCRLHLESGLKLFYNKKAVAYHNHAMDESGLKNRMRNIGTTSLVIHSKYPELKKVPSFFKRGILRLLGNSACILLFSLIRNMSQGRWSGLYFYAISNKYFLEGLEAG